MCIKKSLRRFVRRTSRIVSVFFLSLALFTAGSAFGQNDLRAEDTEKYRTLFQLYSDIALLDTKREHCVKELNRLETEIARQRNALVSLEKEVETATTQYAEMLKFRQMHGETAWVKILFRSRNLKDFIEKISIGEKMNSAYSRAVLRLESGLREHERTVESLLANQNDVTRNTRELEKGISEKKTAARKLEKYLSERGAEYEAVLERLAEKWRMLKPLFRDTIRAFSDLIASGGLPRELVEIRISFAGVRGVIRDDVFNRMLSETLFAGGREDGASGSLTPISFRIADGGVYVNVPEYEVILFGSFDMEKTKLIYRVKRGTFYGIDMGDSAMEDLFMGGTLVFDISNLLEIMNMDLKDCKVQDGYLDVGIELRF